jgi:hypothetical protein
VKKYLHFVKRQPDQRRQQKHHINRISKPLLVLGIIRPRCIQHAPVISLLDFYRDIVAVRIALVQQQFPCTQPARIKIRQIPARTLMRRRIRDLVAHQNSIDIKPHARRGDHGG